MEASRLQTIRLDNELLGGGPEMKSFLLALSVNLVIVAVASAQKPAAEKVDRFAPLPRESHVVSSGELTPTPEMWFYEQERHRWEDPQTLVRASAEERAAQRHARIAAMAWYGMSNARPNVSPDPTDNPAAPHWRSNGLQPTGWIRGRRPSNILLAARPRIRAHVAAD